MRYIVPLCFALIATSAVAGTGSPAEIALGRHIYDDHCSLCHDNSEHMLNDNGPALFGVVGRPVASVEGYDYSEPLKRARRRGLRWTEARLDRFLTNPMTLHPGTSMPMNFDDPKRRKGIIAYLKTLKAHD